MTNGPSNKLQYVLENNLIQFVRFIQNIGKYPHKDIKKLIEDLITKAKSFKEGIIQIKYFQNIEDITPSPEDIVLLFNNITDAIDLQSWQIYRSLCKKLDLSKQHSRVLI